MSINSRDNPCVCSRCGTSAYFWFPVRDGQSTCENCISRLDHPHWPRGRFNGKRIVGVSIKIACDVTDWRWFPKFTAYAHCFNWLCFRVWIHAEYEM